MSYPPQPPGPPPGPFDPQQPRGPYPQDPYQQPPGMPGGFPPGPHGGFPAGPHGGFPAGPPPAKPRKGLIASLIIVAILVVGGGGVAAYFLLNRDDDGGGGSGGDGAGDARSTAESYVREFEKALNTDLADVDLSALKPLACAEDFTELEGSLRDAQADAEESAESSPDVEEVRIEMRDYESTSDGGTFTLVLIEVEDDNNEETKKMTVAQQGDGWQVCGLYAGEEDGGGQDGGSEDGGGEDGPANSEVPPNPIPTT
ncbi:hypothetical protein [Actinophytocola sp.]|uniref:Rv0361 family membrane protein n=1 Tax=Actinophytocola sp. TaxID=1872138 RepID=UPI003D6BDDC9